MIQSLPTILTKPGNIEIVRQFQHSDISFLIVGGAAVAVHGCRDFLNVDDLDLMVEPNAENAGKIISALTAKHVSVPFSAQVLARPAIQVPVKVLHYWLDLLTPERNFNFVDIFNRSILASLDGMQVRVAAKPDVIALKEVAVSRLGAELSKHEQDLKCLKSV